MGCSEQEGSPEPGTQPAMGVGADAVRLELTRGQGCLSELQALLPAEFPSPAGSLVQDALGSIATALSMLDQPQKEEVPAEAPAEPPVASAGRFGEQESKKRRIQQPRRSSSRRRSQPYKWRTITSKTVDDDYAWRKYGQKQIYGSKYPRSYFRCTHKYDRHCQATRQVQHSDEDPSMFVITYFGEHTCIMSTAETPLHQGTSARIIDFSSNASNVAGAASVRKQETEEEAVSSLTGGSSSSELHPMFAELTEFMRGSAQMEQIFAALADQYDVTSGLQYPSAGRMGAYFTSTDAFDHFDPAFNFAED